MTDTTTYKKKILVAIEIEASKELDWFTESWLGQVLAHATGLNADRNQQPTEEFLRYLPQGISIMAHSCPKLATGSVEAAFERIDKLEERLCGCFDKIADEILNGLHRARIQEEARKL